MKTPCSSLSHYRQNKHLFDISYKVISKNKKVEIQTPFISSPLPSCTQIKMSASSAPPAICPLSAPVLPGSSFAPAVHYRINQIAAELAASYAADRSLGADRAHQLGTEATVEMCESFLRAARERRAGIVPPIWVGGAQTPPRAASGGISPLCPGAPRRPLWNSPRIVSVSPPAVLNFSACLEDDIDAPPPLPEPARPASPISSAPAERVGDRVADVVAVEHLENQIRAALENFSDPDRNATANALLAELQRIDPNHPRFCTLHAPYTFGLGSAALGYSRNSRGEYGMYASPCNGCRIGQEEVAADAAPPPLAAGASAGEGTPTPLLSPPRPMWRQGSVGESGPFIGLSFGRSVLLVQRMDEHPSRDAFDLLYELEAELREGEEPDLLAMPEEVVIHGMACSYSWPRERTLEMLAGLRAQQPKTE